MARSQHMLHALSLVAPGTPLREGIDRTLQARMGALLVIGDGPEVLQICSGGFLLDAEFSPQRLSELAKMDGAIVLAGDASRIARANVHLVPDPAQPTSETGTRHRTAERVSRQLNVPVVTISEELHVIAVLYGDEKVRLEDTGRVLARAEQAIAILERSISKAESATQRLAALEVEDLVTFRDVTVALGRCEMVRREIDELESHAIELGVEARLVRFQLEELTINRRDEGRFVVADYAEHREVEEIMLEMSSIATEDLTDTRVVADLLGLPASIDADSTVRPRGWRAISRIARVTHAEAEQVIDRFGSLAAISRAPLGDVAEALDGDEEAATTIKDGLARLAESSILEQYS